MPDHDLRTTIDALCARLQSDLHAQAAQLSERFAAERDAARKEVEAAEAKTAQLWAAKLEAVQEEWQGRLQAGLADAAAEADRRVLAETDRVRREVEAAAGESAERARQEVRHEMERAASDAATELRAEMEQAAEHSNSRLREELEQAATHATSRLREEMDQVLASERARASAELERERTRVQSLLSAERDRAAADLEGERLKAQALAAALEEAQAAVSRERETARQAAASLDEAEQERSAAHSQAVVDARVAERQSQLAAIERLLAAVRTIADARSLSDTLTNLLHAAASVAPRAALFVVSGRELEIWKAAGFGDELASPHLSSADRAASGILAQAVTTRRAVSTATEPAPAFAHLPDDRAGLAVPITVGGQSVAVLYADDASSLEPEAPASWPEAIQVLAAHASACLAQITAVRTTQAIQQMSAAGGARPPAAAEQDSSARRYARLLVSEIKLYNEGAVRTGREKRDLLNRLRPEIERARRLYEERVSPTVGARATYFHQELVLTLADGDSALLGGTV